MKIGILQTGRTAAPLIAQHGDFPDMMKVLLAAGRFDFEIYPVLDDVFPTGVAVCDGWLITGSRFSTYEPLAWIAPLEEFLRKATAARIPVVGICFGHQILAQALGGQVEKSPSGWGVGPSDYVFRDGTIATINAWHQDQVTKKPQAATRLATSSFCTNAALLYGSHALSYQAHPEFTPDFTKNLLDFRRNDLPAQLVCTAERTLKTRPPSPHIAGQIVNFFKTRSIVPSKASA